jgi:hypothetical protein
VSDFLKTPLFRWGSPVLILGLIGCLLVVLNTIMQGVALERAAPVNWRPPTGYELAYAGKQNPAYGYRWVKGTPSDCSLDGDCWVLNLVSPKACYGFSVNVLLLDKSGKTMGSRYQSMVSVKADKPYQLIFQSYPDFPDRLQIREASCL